MELFIGIKLNIKDFFYLSKYFFYLNILPFKTGEIFLISFLKNKGEKISGSIRQFINIKVYDLLAIMIITTIVLLINFDFLISLVNPYINIFLIILPFFILVILILIYFFYNKIKKIGFIKLPVLSLTILIWIFQFFFGIF
jgi:hypothetical protein